MNLNSKVKHAPPITSHFFGFWLSTQAEEGPPSTGNTPPMHNCSTSPNSIPFHTNYSTGRGLLCRCVHKLVHAPSRPCVVSSPLCFTILVSLHALYARDPMLQYRCSHLFGASTQLYVKRLRTFPGAGKVQVPPEKTRRIS